MEIPVRWHSLLQGVHSSYYVETSLPICAFVIWEPVLEQMLVRVCVYVFTRGCLLFSPWGADGLVQFFRAPQCDSLQFSQCTSPGCKFLWTSFPSSAGGTGMWVSLRTGVSKTGSLILAALKLREMVWFQIWLCFSERRKFISLSFISIGLFIQLVTLRGSNNFSCLYSYLQDNQFTPL